MSGWQVLCRDFHGSLLIQTQYHQPLGPVLWGNPGLCHTRLEVSAQTCQTMPSLILIHPTPSLGHEGQWGYPG